MNCMNFKKLILTAFLFVTATFSLFAQNPSFSTNNTKMNQLLHAINELYTDTVDFNLIIEKGVVEMLKELDPHSVYIPVKEVQQANEPLEGAFDGIGVTFQLIKDTINIIEVLIGGPSEKVGLLPGDKIIKVDTADATGKDITNRWVQTHLRGEKGTKVHLLIKRGNKPEPLEFTITRGKIPIHSINVSFMVDQQTGYIRLERFAKDTPDEFKTAITKLKARGMKNLIFDLRGNGGGYLDAAFKISDEFIKDKQLIVFTDNHRKERQDFIATSAGNFEKGKLIILIDEGSASASEIVSGAVQDWDRGLVVGRRTFGKGLVQRPLPLVDKSQVRLTTSQYYTPTGRCIQKPFKDGAEAYYQDLNNRYRHGEYLTADSISFPDSLKYYTPNKRTVYGGGGIMPDIFIPYDTTKYSTLHNELMRKGVFGGFTASYMDNHREELKAQYPTIEEFKKGFQITEELYNQLMEYAHNEGVKDEAEFNLSARIANFAKDKKSEIDSLFTKMGDVDKDSQLEKMLAEYIKDSYNETLRLRNPEKAPGFIKEALTFEIARNLYSFGEAYQIYLINDETFQQAVKLIQDEKIFKQFKVAY